MKRTLAAVGTPAIAALFLLAGGAPAASAGEQHHHRHHGHHSSRPATSVGKQAKAGRAHHHKAKAPTSSSCTVAPKCRPKPLPKPANGWPCAKTHSCASHHHRPICKPPIVAHPVPPIVKQPHSHVGGHKKPHASHVHPAPSQAADALPRTGIDPLVYVFTGGALVCLGALLTLPAGFSRRQKHRDR